MDSGTNKVVVERIKGLCKAQGITPNALSVRAGISQSTIKSIIVGESKNPGVVTIKKLCDGLGITLTEFFETTEFKKLPINKKIVKKEAKAPAKKPAAKKAAPKAASTKEAAAVKEKKAAKPAAKKPAAKKPAAKARKK